MADFINKAVKFGEQKLSGHGQSGQNATSAQPAQGQGQGGIGPQGNRFIDEQQQRLQGQLPQGANQAIDYAQQEYLGDKNAMQHGVMQQMGLGGLVGQSGGSAPAAGGQAPAGGAGGNPMVKEGVNAVKGLFK